MDPDVARELFHQGGTLIFLDVPEGTEFGIDYNSWTVGPKFIGVKMIPPGIHFIYFRSVSSSRDAGPRTGFFYNFKQQEILVKKWNPQNEDTSDQEISEEELERFREKKMDLDPSLGAYPYDSYKKWVSLTNHMTSDIVERIQPISGKINAVAMFQSRGSNTRERLDALAKQQESETTSSSSPGTLPEMKVIPGTEIRFTPIPQKKYPPDATPAVMTKYSIDSSYVLQTLLDGVYQESTGILGELQFSFICFLIGQNLDAFEQWKKLVALMCACDEALQKYAGLFSQFITTMHYHVQEIPEDFFVDIVSQNNFLTVTLQEFFSNLEASEASDQLKTKGERFKEHLQRKFKWDFTTEPDDYAPVVVE